MTTTARRNLLDFDRPALEAELAAVGWQAFRARQIVQWIYHRDVADFQQMTNLSKLQRDWLEERYCVVWPEVAEEQRSQDGTVKWSMRVAGGQLVETVLIPEGQRRTLCVSSQVGCMLDCSFCATGKQGFNGNLTTAQIIGQVGVANRQMRLAGDSRPVTNVVLMGMGEPLLNFDAVLRATNLMTDDLAFGLAKRRVTVSTAGVVPAIYQLADVTDVALAVSLHAPTDELRNELVPINRKYNIAQLLEACHYYLRVLGERRSITIEYTLLHGVNDSLVQARQLARLLRGLRCKINLIPFNPFPGSGYASPTDEAVRAFQAYLSKHGYSALCRTTRGADIDAACGQLVGQVTDRTKRAARHRERLAQGQAAAEQGTLEVSQPVRLLS